MVVGAVMIFGSGVAGLSILTHTHTLPTLLVVHPLTQTLLPLHELLNTEALQFRVLPIVVYSHTEGFFPIFCLHAQNLLGFTHVVSSPADLRMMCSYPLPTG